MTIKEKLATIKSGQMLIVAAPNIQHLMTGTRSVVILPCGMIRITYPDGETEQRQAADALLHTMDADDPNLFSLVSFVQAGRRG